MRGGYRSGQRRVLSGAIYKVIIGVILLVAVALAVTLLAVLPAMNDTITPEKKIVSIEAVSGNNVGVGSNASLIPVRVTYSDGTKEEINLGNTTFSGLDVTTTGQQNVVLSYGGFEQTVQFNVVDIDCHVHYSASVGGKIQGEADQVVASGNDASTVIAVPETGYVFDKWSDGYHLQQRKDEKIIEKEFSVLAIFKKAQYYVRFFYNDGTSVGSEEKVTYGEVPTKVPSYGDDPMMDVYGYVFTGWSPNLYVDVDGEQRLVTIDRNMDFYPEYVKRATDYKVTVPTDKYGQAMGQLEIRGTPYQSTTVEGYFAHDELATILATPYNSREFAYWQVEDVDGNLYVVPKEGSLAVTVGQGGEQLTFTSTRSGSSVQDYNLSFTPNDRVAQVSIRAIFAYSASDVTFVNYQNPENNNVELKVSGLPFGTPLIMYKAGDVDLTAGLPTPAEPVGMQFEGWYELGDATRTLLDGSETFEQPTTLVARWKRMQYTLVFSYVDDRDESVEWHRTVVTYQDAFASGTNGGLPLTNPTKEKYVFLGWQDAVTGNSVDDRTKLYAESAHVENDDFINNHRLNIIPIWAAKSHVLRVDFTGSGTAKLVVDKNKIDAEGNSLSQTLPVLGEIEITEDHTYELAVEAMEGYKLVSAMWYYSDFGTPFSYGDGVTRATFALQETSDNSLFAEFSPIRLTVAVENGSDAYSGLVEYGDEVYSARDTALYVNYNDTAVVRIVSQNPVYYISAIYVDHSLIDGFYMLEQNVREYTFVLENLKENVDVQVTYATAEYFINLSVGDGGMVYETDLYDRATETVFEAKDSYAYGEEVYLRIKGDFGPAVRKYLSAIRINGVLYDPFTGGHPDVKLYSYKINGVDYGVDLVYIGGEYYYSYGVAEYEGTEYLFAHRTDGYETAIFILSDEYGDVAYTELTPSAEGYGEIYAALYDALNVEEKNLYDTSVVRDGRITEVDVRISVADDYNVVLSFADVKYSVEAFSDGYGTVSISDPTPDYGESCVLVATPDAGYYVAGYSFGEETIPVVTAVKGESYRLNLTNVDEDKEVTFLFERIGHKVVFLNTTLTSGDLFVDGIKLNASIAVSCYYHGAVSATVTAADGKRISAISIDGNAVDVHYNQSTYELYLPDVTSDVVVRLAVSDRTVDQASGEVYALAFATGETAVGSAEYTVAAVSDDNDVLLTTKYGYSLSSVVLRDKENGTEYIPSGDPRVQETFAFTIPAGTFSDGARVEVVASTSPKQYVLTTSAGENGSISTGSRPTYGDPVSVDVTANDNCYLSAVYVNGEKISFETDYWSGLRADPNTGNYVYGLFSYVATSDMDVRAEFAVNSYKVSVDASGVNGTTVLSVGDSIADVAPHGAYLHVSMTADHGYHVSELYVNGVRVTDLTFDTDDENERTHAVYTYKGAYVAGAYTGVTARTTIKVVYEINRYYFVFNLVNDSANFDADLNMGTLTSAYTLNGNRYYGIEHGSNFSFDVTPTISNGYYLYSLTIDYTSSLGANVVTRTYEDGYFDKTGGTIWFNRFVNDDSGDTGVVANISGITAVFRRNLYEFSFRQIGTEETGSVAVQFSHPNANVTGVYLFDGEQTQERGYWYRGGVFYRRTPSGDVATTIAARYVDGEYKYVDGEDVEYEMLVEHGLRYTVTAAPALGYERTSLTINGAESNGFVSENRYSTNVVGAVEIVASYRILVYDVTFSTSVVDKNLTSTIDADRIANYMSISVVLLEGAAYDADYMPVVTLPSYPIPDYVDRISLFNDYGVRFSYGSRIRFVMTPKFSETGYYVYNFFLGANEIPDLSGDRLGEAYYDGPSGTGYPVLSDVTARCSFRVMRYAVTTSVTYDEDITGETANTLVEESGGSIAWGDTAYIKVTVGQGYTLQDIFVRRAGESEDRVVDLLSTSTEDLFDEQMYYALRNDRTNEIRDVLLIKDVKQAVSVRAVYTREKHVFRYVFNDSSLLSTETRYNPQNPTFPQATDVDGTIEDAYWEGDTLVLPTAYYDELFAVLTPNNGFRIVETTAVVRAVYYDRTSGEYLPLVDNAGEEIVTTIDLVNLGNDKKRFTFHNETSQLAALYVRYDLEVRFNVVIKTYELTTNIDRVSVVGVENNPEISLDVKDRTDNYVSVNGILQMPELLHVVGEGEDQTATEQGLKMVAEHKGHILYTFDAPEGFMVNRLEVNGYEWTDLRVANLSDERLRLNVESVTVSGARFYRYSIRFLVEDPLISGRNNLDLTRIVVSIRIAPVQYSIKILINDRLMEQTTIVDGSGTRRNGVTDGSTLSVYSPQSANHYSTIAVEPALYEGYEVTGLTIRSGGDYDDVVSADDERLSACVFSLPAKLDARTNYRIGYATLPNVDVLTDELTVYYFFTTHIVSYTVEVETYAHTLDENFRSYPEFGDGSEGIVPFDSLAGTLQVTLTTGGETRDFVSGSAYEYFSNVKVSFAAKPGYKMYVATELLNGEYVELATGVNGIRMESTVSPSGAVQYTFEYTVNSLGGRSFRIVFKQETTVTVHLPNPFKYFDGGVHRSYATLEAYENGVLLVNENDDGSGKVQDLFVYTVLVGNYVSFKYSDTNARPGQTGATFCTYDPDAEKYTEAALYIDSRYTSGDKGIGKVINTFTELYVVNNVYGYISFTKTTHSATEGAIGGDVYFNSDSIEPASGVYYNAQTTVGKEVTVTVSARENFVLSRLLVRQIDYARSVALGYVVYRTGAYEYLEYDPETFVYDDQNGFSIKRTVDSDPAGKTVYKIVMKGDMELAFEFYRVYTVRYGVQFADKNAYTVENGILNKDDDYAVTYCYPNAADQSTQEIKLISVNENDYAPATSATPYLDDYMYVQYNGVFTLTAPNAPEGYVFVGWYVNKYNVYTDLDIAVPSERSVENQTFYVNETDTEGIMEKVSEFSDERSEAIVLDIRAIYMPVINVAIINELYYYDLTHWNSWAPGAVRIESFEYRDNAVPPDSTLTTFPTSNNAKTLAEIGNEYNTLLADATDLAAVVSSRRSTAGYDTEYGWNLAFAETTRTTDPVPTNYEVYSSMKNFSMLYRYIASDDFVYDSWQDSTLSMELVATPSTVQLLGWQYYNWSTGAYEDVGYRYEDRNYGQDIYGNYTTVDNTYTAYSIDLSYLYAHLTDEYGNVTSDVAMPYAVSITTADNSENNRPLIIRPRFLKVARLEVSQMAYLTKLGEENGERAVEYDFGNVVHPAIGLQVENATYNKTPDATLMSGDFDYGSTVHIDYYQETVADYASPEEQVPCTFEWQENGVVMEYRYRFVGWRLKWTVNGSTAFRYIYYADPTVPYSGRDGIDFDLRNEYGDEPPADVYELQAVYIKQHLQSVYAYNVAGSDLSYEKSLEQGKYAYENAPDIAVGLVTPSASINSYGDKFFNRATGQVTDVRLENSMQVYLGEEETKYKRFLVDAGASYDLTVYAANKLANATDTTNSTALGAFGYDPDFDREYRRIQNKNTASENIVLPTATRYTGERFVANGTFTYDLQYASDAILIFNNVMYNSGIAVSDAFAEYVTDGAVRKLTVWDVDGDYGDGTTVADGRVYIKTTLINTPNLGGNFGYSLNGFKSGNGITALVDLYYYVNSAKATNAGYLFAPSHSSFRRYVAIDYDGGGYVSGGSQLFGDPNYSGAGGRFSPQNTGDGTEQGGEGYGPFTIYNVTQLRNLSLYFNANEYTCAGVHFALRSDIKLQNVNSSASDLPYGTSKAWVPLTFHLENGNYLGFDGVLDGEKVGGGGNHTLYGLAASRDNLLMKNETSVNPLADFDYTGLEGYGIFGCVNGGTIRNINIGNAFVSLPNFGARIAGTVNYVGVLTARAYNANFSEITFAESGYTAGRTTTTDGKGAGSTTFIDAVNAMGVGLLAGYFRDSVATRCAITLTAGYDLCLRAGATGSVGSLVGLAEGTGTRTQPSVSFSDVAFTGSTGALCINNDSAGRNIGGLVGKASGAAFTNVRATNANMFLGSTAAANNVGGIVGVMINSSMESSYVYSANTSNRFTDTAGVFMTYGLSAVGGDALATETAYGKAGGIVGYADNCEVTGVSGVSVRGVFTYYGAVAGGVIGVANRSLVQGLEVRAPSYGSDALIMMVRNALTATTAYGSILGAAISKRTETTVPMIVNECKVLGGGNSAQAGVGDLTDTALYVYRRDNLTDSTYQTIYDNDSQRGDALSYASTYGKNLATNKTYAGGIVGYLSGALYNSYTSHSRVTVKYVNRAPGVTKSSMEWAVSLGGLVGYLDVTQQESTFFGFGTIAPFDRVVTSGDVPYMNYNDYLNKPMSRVQSCFSVGSSLALGGYIWCDNFEARSGEYNVQLGRAGATLGGIVGATSIGSKYGNYAVNSCYTLNCNYIRNLGAYGLSNDGAESNAGAPDEGWIKHEDKAFGGFGWTTLTYYCANRAGVWMEGGVFGIVSGYMDDESKFGGACNYCWCKGNTSVGTNSSWKSIEDLTGNKDGTETVRGLSYVAGLKEAQPNATCLLYPYETSSGETINAGFFFVSGYGGLASTPEQIAVNGYVVDRNDISIIYGGAFAGVYGDVDGRVYKTDIATGLPLVAHQYCSSDADANSEEEEKKYFWVQKMNNGWTVCVNFHTDSGAYYQKGYYNDFYKSGSVNLSDYLVAGQPNTPIQ